MMWHTHRHTSSAIMMLNLNLLHLKWLPVLHRNSNVECQNWSKQHLAWLHIGNSEMVQTKIRPIYVVYEKTLDSWIWNVISQTILKIWILSAVRCPRSEWQGNNRIWCPNGHLQFKHAHILEKKNEKRVWNALSVVFVCHEFYFW